MDRREQVLQKTTNNLNLNIRDSLFRTPTCTSFCPNHYPSRRNAPFCFSILLCVILPTVILCPSQSAGEDETVKSIRVAVCQILCIDSDRDGNFARIEHALGRAKDQGAQIACLPETCILGWVNPEAHSLACPIPGKDTERLSSLAQRYGIMVAAGLAEKENIHLYDTAVLIDRDGTILLKHRKMNLLTHLMDPPYTPGKEIAAVDTRLGRLGLLICADTFVGEHLEQMKEQKPDLVLVPYGWAAEKDKWPDHGKNLASTVSKAAKAIGAPVVGVDLVGSITHGPWTGQTYGGQSVVADGSGRILAAAEDRDVDVLIVDIPIGRE